jgi:hypothetical protein
MFAVQGKKNVYALKPKFADDDYDHYLRLVPSVSDPAKYSFMESSGGRDGAAEIEFILDASSKTYRMIDSNTSTYISYCTSDCANGYWLTANHGESQSSAMTMKLISLGPSVGWGYCTSNRGVPEQVNVQLAGPDSVVINFVTFEAKTPAGPPVVTVGLAEDENKTADKTPLKIRGVTHTHVTAAGDRTYYMHFVRLSELKPRGKYHYTVQSGADDAVVSKSFSFRAPYGSDAPGETKVIVYGDMGKWAPSAVDNLFRSIFLTRCTRNPTHQVCTAGITWGTCTRM